MTKQYLPKECITLTSLSFILLATSFILIAANRAQAEEILYLGRQVYAEQQIYSIHNTVQPTYTQQQVEFDSELPLEQKDACKFTLGAGAIYMPAFVGSKDYQTMAFPNIKMEYKGRFFASLFEGVGYNIIYNERWHAGPIMKYNLGRTEGDDNPLRIAGKKTNTLRGLGDVHATLELGGFVEYNFKPFSYKLELRQGVGGHKGLIVETGLNYIGFTKRLGKPIMYSFGPHAIFADSNYNNAYFGINQTQSANSGLAKYNAGSGLVSYGIEGFAVISVSKSISVGVFGGYDRLGSVATDSPLIRERGNENQFMGGLRTTYEFGR